jgi:pullulanase
MNNLGAAYYITAQGIPFIHAGEEMLRSKPDAMQENGFNHNSYNAGDEINAIRWNKLQEELVASTHAYYQGLIAFRNAHPAMRLTTKADITAAMTELETENLNVVAFVNNGAGMEKAIVSIFNADAAAQIVTLPEGKWAICVNKTTAGTEVLGVAEGSVQVEATSAMILVEADADAEVTEKPVETEEKGFFARIWEAIVNFFAKLFGKKN